MGEDKGSECCKLQSTHLSRKSRRGKGGRGKTRAKVVVTAIRHTLAERADRGRGVRGVGVRQVPSVGLPIGGLEVVPVSLCKGCLQEFLWFPSLGSYLYVYCVGSTSMQYLQ